MDVKDTTVNPEKPWSARDFDEKRKVLNPFGNSLQKTPTPREGDWATRSFEDKSASLKSEALSPSGRKPVEQLQPRAKVLDAYTQAREMETSANMSQAAKIREAADMAVTTSMKDNPDATYDQIEPVIPKDTTVQQVSTEPVVEQPKIEQLVVERPKPRIGLLARLSSMLQTFRG